MADSPTASGLVKLANDRIEDAKALLTSGRYDGAVYLSGYAVELALKARICRHLGWMRFDVTSIWSHSLELLFRFSGLQSQKKTFEVHWSLFAKWDPQMRYDEGLSFSEADARERLNSAIELMQIFL